HRALLEPLARTEDAVLLPNPGWRRGRTGSIQVGLEWADGADGVVLWPIDHPFVEPGTVGRLLEVARGDPLALWVGPTFRGRGGHPVTIKSAAFPAIMELGPDEPLRRVLARLGVQVRRVEVRDTGVLSGTDTPEEYERARAEHARARGGAWTVG
ncbi:MAG TPA: NTP transferase domain-containing protein, partial [Thermoplasmata archaeon]